MRRSASWLYITGRQTVVCPSSDSRHMCSSEISREELRILSGVPQWALKSRVSTDLQLHVHHHGTPKVHIQCLVIIFDISLQYLPGNPPSSFKDHKKAKNLYLSRYRERWMNKLKSSTAILKFCCIIDLIRFMMNEA